MPPISVGDFQSQPLALNVGELPVGSDRVLFIEAFVDNESPYVQSQVLLTVKVWQSVNVLDSNKVNLGSDEFLTVSLERDKEYIDTRDGKEYLVQEQQFALFPQTSGVHTFGPIELRAKVPVSNSRSQGFFTPSRNVKRISNPVTMNVQARPSATKGQWWLPASDVQLLETWSGDPKNIDANQTITRTIEILANGVSVDQLPEIKMPEIDGLKLYADNTDQASSASDAGIVASQKVTWAVVPERNGDIEIPAVNLTWFKTELGETQVATLPAQTLVVSGVVQEASPNVALSSENGDENANDGSNALITPGAAGNPRSSNSPNWLWLLIGAAVLACFQALAYTFWRLWKFTNRTKTRPPSGSKDIDKVPGFGRIRAASKQRKLKPVQEAILDWAAEFWPQTPPKNLLNVAQRLEEPKLVQVFEQIDASLYGVADHTVDLSGVDSLMQSAASRLVDGSRVVTQGSKLPSL